MTPVPAAVALLAAPFLFLVPGLIWLALLPRRDQEETPGDEAAFLVVAVSVTAAAWVALLLAELGCFSLVHAALVLGGASALLALGLRRRLGWPRLAPFRFGELAPAVAVLALAVGLQARPSEYIVGGRDPGTYIAAMAVIGRTGAITNIDPVVLSIPPEDVELFYRHPENPDFSWGRFMGFPLERPQTGRVTPEFFHLFPAFGAYLFQAMGVKGALATPPLFGVLGTLAVFFALRRVLGPAPALLGSLLLGCNVLQVWFARYPVSEVVSQFLMFLALLALARFEAAGSRLFGWLAGAVLGVSLLVRIDSALVALPLAVYLIAQRTRGGLSRAQARTLWLPFGLLGVHAVLHAALFSRKYVLNIVTRPYWDQPAAVWLALGAVGIVLALLGHRLTPPLARFLDRYQGVLRDAGTGALVLLLLYAYFLRPQLSAWAGGDGNDPALVAPFAPLLVALGFHRLAAHDAQALVRLGWFVSPLALLLATFGLCGLLRRCQARQLFMLLTLGTYAGFYLYKIRIYNDYFFAMRRFMPVILPLALGLAGSALCTLARHGRPRRALAAALAAGLLVLYLRDTGRVLNHVDWKGSVRFVNDVARRFSPDDVVIFEQAQSIHLLSLPLWAIHGLNVLELARFNPDPERLRHLAHAWRGRYRNIYFVHTYRTDLCGLFLQRVEEYAFGTSEWERSYGAPPRHAEPRALHFRISRVTPPEELQVPALPEVDIGGSDDLQVSGFFDKEGAAPHTYRWTGACGSVYVPGVAGATELVVTASSGLRPPDRPALVSVSLSGQPLGEFLAGPDWREQRLALPPRLPPGPPVLRFDVPAWRPANTRPGDADTRDLGVMLDRILLAKPPASR